MPITQQTAKTSLQPPGLLLVLAILAVVPPGCSTSPQVDAVPTATVTAPAEEPPRRRQSHPAVAVALAQLDSPYRYGGLGPRSFDCSGLVHFAFGQSGVSLPRTTLEQYRQSQAVSLQSIQPGDLIFFRSRSRKPTHVGIYLGDQRFIHASTSERAVVISSLDNPYWRKRLLSVGRYSLRTAAH